LPRRAFSIRETALWREVVATKFQGTPLPPCAPGGAPSSRISGINSTLCYIQIRAVEFFRYNEILPGAPPASLPCEASRRTHPPPAASPALHPPSLPCRVPCSLYDARGSSSLHYRKLRNVPECHFLFIIMLMPRWPLLSSWLARSGAPLFTSYRSTRVHVRNDAHDESNAARCCCFLAEIVTVIGNSRRTEFSARTRTLAPTSGTWVEILHEIFRGMASRGSRILRLARALVESDANVRRWTTEADRARARAKTAE
jgi:hypothetical protein